MKRIFSAALAVVLMLALCPCGAAAQGTPAPALAAASGSQDTIPIVKSPLAVGWQDYYAIRQDGTLIAWGQPEFGGFDEEVTFEKPRELLKNAAAVYTSGRGATVAIDNDGVLWAFNTAQFNDTVPGVDYDWERDGMKPIKIMDNVAMAAMDQFHTMILKRDGTLWVNGTGSFGAPWLHKTNYGYYLVKIMDNVIWTDLHHAVTADHELWGWRMTGQDDQLPRKLADLDEGVTQVSWANLALTEEGGVYHWDVDENGEITRLQHKLSRVVWCGGQLAIMEGGGLWYYVEDLIPGRPGWEQPDLKGDFRGLTGDVVYAAQGETDILAIKRDGSLWKFSPKDGESGYPSEAVRLGGGFAASSGANASLDNFTPTATYKDGQFSDVKSGDWFVDNVRSAFELGLMKGDSASTFAPGKTITQAEAITVAARVRDIYCGGGADFTPKAGEAWYQPYVDYVTEHNMISTFFGPYSQPATRAQFAWLLYCALADALEPINPDIAFSDVSDSDYHHDAIMTMARAGVMQGRGGGKFDPDASVLRSEAAAMLSRAVQPGLRLKDQKGTDATEPPLDEASLSAAVPDFLDAEQQLLYRRAHCVYGHLFAGDTAYSCIWEEGDAYPAGWGEVEYNGIGYTKATGRYAAWEDFDALVHSVFTDRLWDSLNAVQRAERFINIDGAMHFILASRGMYYYNDNFPDTFKLTSKTDDEITFTLTGHYSSPWPNEGESSEDRDKRLTSGWDYTIDFPIKMVRTADGWRFDMFHNAAADQEEPPAAKTYQDVSASFDKVLLNSDYAKEIKLERDMEVFLQVPAGWKQSGTDFADEKGTVAMKLYHLSKVDTTYTQKEGEISSWDAFLTNSGLNPAVKSWPVQTYTHPRGYMHVLCAGTLNGQSGIYGWIGNSEYVLYFSAFADKEQTLWNIVDSIQIPQ